MNSNTITKGSLLILVCFAMVLSSSVYAGGSSYHYRGGHHGYYFAESGSAEAMVADAIIARPIGLVTTILGSAVYVVSLPFSLLGGNEKQAREKLVKEPKDFTFRRPLGDFDSLKHR